MKFFFNDDENMENIVTMLAVDDNKVLTSHKQGEIRLWKLTIDRGSYHFDCERVFWGHSEEVHCLALLSRNRFISASADDTMRVWNLRSSHCKQILEESVDERSSVSLSDCESIVGLSDNLIAVAGLRSPAWGCFDVWDISTGACLFQEQNLIHRPHGMSLAMTTTGYLAVQGNCGGEVSIWKISATKCKKISECDDQRIYSITAGYTGEIITAGNEINIFTLSSKGQIQKLKTLVNTNVIDEVIPLDGYRVLTVDRQGSNAGTLKLWNYLSDTCQSLGDSRTSSGVTYAHIVLKKRGLILSTNGEGLLIQHSPKISNLPKDFMEIRKNCRVLSQAYRTQTSFFALLPQVINVEIAALTATSLDAKISKKIATDHVGFSPLGKLLLMEAPKKLTPSSDPQPPTAETREGKTPLNETERTTALASFTSSSSSSSSHSPLIGRLSKK